MKVYLVMGEENYEYQEEKLYSVYSSLELANARVTRMFENALKDNYRRYEMGELIDDDKGCLSFKEHSENKIYVLPWDLDSEMGIM